MEISYPVYSILGSAVPSKDGTVTFTYSETTNEEEELIYNFKVVDDTSMKADTLGKRRLLILNSGASLQKVGKAIFFLGDLIKIAKRGMYFIDSTGRVFQYRKSTRAKLQFKRLINVIPIATGGAILEVEGIHSRFKCLFLPKTLELYVGVLEFGKSHILYGLYEQPYKSSWRMI
jgi:hypothetical protein